MAAIITLGLMLAFLIFGACERLIPRAERVLGSLSGITFVLAVLWALYLGSSWGLHKLGITSNQLPGFLNTTAWLSAATGQVLIVAGITALIGGLFLPVCLSWRKSKHLDDYSAEQDNSG